MLRGYNPAMLAILVWLCVVLQGSPQPHRLTVSVSDENAIPVASAQITLEHSITRSTVKGETDYSGKRVFDSLEPGVYQVRVAKKGFYAALVDQLRAGETLDVTITLNHEQELRDSVNVIYSPPVIDSSRTAASQTLDAREIVNIPYPTSRDYRNVLPFIPGVIADWTGQIHVNGAATHQIVDQFDGFNISHPATGLLELRVSPDGLRSIDVLASRFSSQYGKGSGGVVNLTSGMGDDRFRFMATDFLPSFQVRKGFNINGWTPRATVSGPIRKGKSWFFNAWDGEYNLDIIEELEEGEDSNHAWRLNNLAKVQFNLNQTSLVTAAFVVNQYRSYHAGIGPFFPKEATRRLEQAAYLVTLKHQSYFSNGMFLELGFGATQFEAVERALGDRPFVIAPQTRAGNFFRSTDGLGRRLQWIGNLNLAPHEWHGRHDVRVGAGVDLIDYSQTAFRRQVFVRRNDGTLARTIYFDNRPESSRANFELSGFAEDRWSLSDRWLVELGLRFDWDQILRRPLFSPRLASTYMIGGRGETKVSFGAGLFYDATNLGILANSGNGKRFDQFYDRDGTTPRSDLLVTSFEVNEHDLTAPRFSNWSVGIEHRLPGAIYLDVEYIGRHGTRGLAYLTPGTGAASGVFELQNERRDRYDGLQFTLRRTFKDTYSVMASYTRSSSRSNVAIEPGFDDPVFSPVAGGPLPWDSPNRFLSWGWMPLPKKFELSYSIDWHDGFPFSVVNEDQRMIGAVNSHRFPVYFAFNLHVERRFRLLNFEWALRAGFNNITDHKNAALVDNNIDSPFFLTYQAIQGRTFTGRVRFLGRK